MKKIYKAPVLKIVNLDSEESFLITSPGHLSGTIENDGTEIGTDIGTGDDHGDSKKGFWDDDYED